MKKIKDHYSSRNNFPPWKRILVLKDQKPDNGAENLIIFPKIRLQGTCLPIPLVLPLQPGYPA